MTMQMSRKLMIGSLTLWISVISLTACSGGSKVQAPAIQPGSQAQTPTVIVTTVESRVLNRQVRLPGELQAYQDTAIYAKVPGFVAVINVDRGSVVKKGQLLARLRAPELDTQRGEAEAKVRAAQSQRVEAQSKVRGSRSRPHSALERERKGGSGAGQGAGRERRRVTRSGALFAEHRGIPPHHRALRRRHHRAQRSQRQPGQPGEQPDESADAQVAAGHAPAPGRAGSRSERFGHRARGEDQFYRHGFSG